MVINSWIKGASYLCINSLLRTLIQEGFDLICYVDDFVIHLRWQHFEDLCGKAENALQISFNCSINPDKMEICIFIGKMKIFAYYLEAQ